jgi:hypothetical protein
MSTSAHGGHPSHVSQILRSQIPSSNLSMRWMSAMLPHRVQARNLVALLTNSCFKCLQKYKTITTTYLIQTRIKRPILPALILPNEGCPLTFFLHLIQTASYQCQRGYESIYYTKQSETASSSTDYPDVEYSMHVTP